MKKHVSTDRRDEGKLSTKYLIALALFLGGFAVYACSDLDDEKKCGEEQNAQMPDCIQTTCGESSTCNSYLVLSGQENCDQGLMPCTCTTLICGTKRVMNPQTGLWEIWCDPANQIGSLPGSGSGSKATLSGGFCTDYPG